MNRLPYHTCIDCYRELRKMNMIANKKVHHLHTFDYHTINEKKFYQYSSHTLPNNDILYIPRVRKVR